MAKAAVAERAPEDHVNDDVDNVPEVDDFRTGEVGEGDFIESLARKAGWVSKEEWKRDPAKHVDARAYLEKLPDELETAKDRLRRTAQANEFALEEVRRQERLKALEEVRLAERAGDTAAADAAVERVKQAEGPSPQVRAWIRDNPWFTEDREAAEYAAVITNRLALQGRSEMEQLEEARAAVMKRFPEHSGQAVREPTEARLSEVRRPPVQAGSRGPSSAPRERGWGDLPPAARTAAAPFLRAFKSRGLSETEAQAKYAGDYWRDQA